MSSFREACLLAVFFSSCIFVLRFPLSVLGLLVSLFPKCRGSQASTLLGLLSQTPSFPVSH